MKSHRTWILVAYLVAAAGACGVGTPSAWGQAAAAPPSNEPPQLTVYKLRHMDALSAAEHLRQLIGSGSEDVVKIVPDIRTNSLLVQAPTGQQEIVVKTLELIDAEAPREQMPEIKILTLQYARASELSEVMKAVADKHDVRLAIDQRSNAIIAIGRTEGLSILLAVLERLDTPAPNAKRSSQPLRVRIVWLVEGREQEKLPAPSADLRGVVDELTRLGFQDLGRVSQILIRVDAKDSEFRAAGSADLGGKTLRLSVEGASADVPGSGRKEPTDGQVRLNLRINVAQHDGDERLCSLDTELTTSLGHSTVLGTTPIGQKSAVFVVQVLPPEK